jgi:hypothetical protein
MVFFKEVASVLVGGTAMLLAMATLPASAQNERERMIDALNNVQGEMVACMAYYSIVKQCFAQEPDRTLYDQTSQIFDRLNGLSVKVGKTIGMTADAMLARLQMNLDEQMQLTGKSCLNISSLFVRYSDRCKQVVENADSILLQYLNRK